MSPEALIFPISHLLKDLSHSAVCEILWNGLKIYFFHLRFMEKYPTGVITKKQFSDEMGVDQLLLQFYDEKNEDDDVDGDDDGHHLDVGGHLVRLGVQHVR